MGNDSNHRAGGDGLGQWLLPLLLLFFVPPLGAVLIFLKLMGGGGKRHGERESSVKHAGARTSTVKHVGGYEADAGERGQSVPQEAPTESTDALFKKKRRKSRRLSIIGGVITVIFGLILVSELGDALSYGSLLSSLGDLLPLFSFAAGGAGMWLAGIFQGRKLRRFSRYLSMIGKRKSISVSQLSEATGLSPEKVRGELQDMLDEGFFPSGFLDYGGDQLVLSGQGLEEEKPVERQAPVAQEDRENEVLREIRAVNDAIAHEKLSAQIDRIGVITARIFDYQKSHPDREAELHSFLSYYLPTTLKILRAYAQLEAQGVEGENIKAAKQRIEGMMDKVVEGFEKQLDQLFQVDMMDVTTDVKVLEQMLKKDGLTDDGAFQTLSL